MTIIYNDPRFWELAPLSATCAGTAWALQGLWATPWLTDVDGLPQADVTWHLLIIAIVQGIAALLLGSAADRLRRRGVGPQVLLAFVATTLIAAQLAVTLRLQVSSYLPWSIVAAAGSGPILSYAILAEYFPKEMTGRANGALNVFHFGAAFVIQYIIGVVVAQWPGWALSGNRVPGRIWPHFSSAGRGTGLVCVFSRSNTRICPRFGVSSPCTCAYSGCVRLSHTQPPSIDQVGSTQLCSKANVSLAHCGPGIGEPRCAARSDICGIGGSRERHTPHRCDGSP